MKKNFFVKKKKKVETFLYLYFRVLPTILNTFPFIIVFLQIGRGKAYFPSISIKLKYSLQLYLPMSLESVRNSNNGSNNIYQKRKQQINNYYSICQFIFPHFFLQNSTSSLLSGFLSSRENDTLDCFIEDILQPVLCERRAFQIH